MSLTRGPKSKFPCTRCLIPANKQGTYPPERADPRTSADTQEIVQNARSLGSGDQEELLKSFGLRDIDVHAIFSVFSCSHNTQQNVF